MNIFILRYCSNEFCQSIYKWWYPANSGQCTSHYFGGSYKITPCQIYNILPKLNMFWRDNDYNIFFNIQRSIYSYFVLTNNLTYPKYSLIISYKVNISNLFNNYNLQRTHEADDETARSKFTTGSRAVPLNVAVCCGRFLFMGNIIKLR